MSRFFYHIGGSTNVISLTELFRGLIEIIRGENWALLSSKCSVSLVCLSGSVWFPCREVSGSLLVFIQPIPQSLHKDLRPELLFMCLTVLGMNLLS